MITMKRVFSLLTGIFFIQKKTESFCETEQKVGNVNEVRCKYKVLKGSRFCNVSKYISKKVVL